jgi:ERCC4-related helicase
MMMMPRIKRSQKRKHKSIKDQYEDGIENSVMFVDKRNGSPSRSKRSKDDNEKKIQKMKGNRFYNRGSDEEGTKVCPNDDVQYYEDKNYTNEDNEHDKINIFDEHRFFSTTSAFPDKVLEEARSQIYTRIEEPLRRLEQGGHELFLDYLKEKNNTQQSRNHRSHEEAMRKSLDDAYISGDIRGYQRKLLDVALSKNIIINLSTGSGKTLIALLCIKEMKQRTKKQTLFLVPSVALAIQHSTTLQSNLPGFRVETACYATSSSKTSRKTLAYCDIIVATHGAVSFQFWRVLLSH